MKLEGKMRMGKFCVAALFTGAVCVACSGSSSGAISGQPSARDQAVTAACGRFNDCGAIGPGKTYASADDCRVDQENFWQKNWPPKTCDNHIDGAQLNTCIDTIHASDCNNPLDLANIALNKCTSAKVCGA
jgi:hypothetical protein